MDKKQAQTLIKKTFESPFDKGRFNGFIKNLLNQFDETKAFSRPMRGQFIREAFRDSITEFDRLGRFTDIDGKKIDILTVCLQKEKSIENARTQQRNFISNKYPFHRKLLKKSNQKEITSLVEKIHTAAQSNDYLSNAEKQSKVKEYERQIDRWCMSYMGLPKKK